MIELMNQVYVESIAKAKSYYDNFNDVIHDWEHSERVATNARLIADHIGYEDKDFLTLCALWHDTARTEQSEGHEEQSALLAEKDLIARGVDKEIGEKAYEVIRFHKSTANPTTTEGKIMRDADKLDIFTAGRWKKCAVAGWKKEYVDDLQKTVETMGKYPDAFTYDYTKELFKQRVPSFLRYYDTVKNQLPVQ